MARNLGHARADDTANKTKNMSHNVLNYRDFTMEAETILVYQLCSLRLLIHRSQTFRRRESHFRDLEADAVLGLVSKWISTFYGQ